MFVDEDLKKHLETSSVVRLQSAVIAEWNMNSPENIHMVGNYRFRPTDGPGSKYGSLPNNFDRQDFGNYYTGATYADVVVDGGFDEDDLPVTFISDKKKENLLYSLEDCFGKFRPRSGINKLRYFDGKVTHHTNINLAERPRYYMSSKEDIFKYWTSYRTEAVDLDGDGKMDTTVERGIASSANVYGRNYIDDTAPFVVYKNPVPANRVVVKMQTHVGTKDLGPFSSITGSFGDPLFGESNKYAPVKWKIQYLENDSWADAIVFDNQSSRIDGSPIVKADGYVEIAYGLVVPDKYRDFFVKAGEYTSEDFLPTTSIDGYAYLIKENSSDIGYYKIWQDELSDYATFVPTYEWYVEEETINRATNFITDLTNPESFTDTANQRTRFREFQNLQGLRIVVETMNKSETTFDLIELSPRLAVDLSDKTSSFSVKKSASDLGVAGLPVSQLLASTGSLELFDYDQAFWDTNTTSLIYGHSTKTVQIKLYEVVVNVNNYDYHIPIKTMYVEGLPSINNEDRSVSLKLRDMFFHFESQRAPEILIQNASVSYAASLLLDSIGFSNYMFKRNADENETTIPYFFVAPDISVAQALQDLAISTQTAMFFDEYNNFIMMSKDYMMPTLADRETDATIYGSNDFVDTGILENGTSSSSAVLANMISITGEDMSPYNNGQINYTTRYIQRSYGAIRQAMLLDKEKTWIYKPVPLWAVSGTDNTKSENDETSQMSTYTLSAIPLNSNLTNVAPYVLRNTLVNNVMDLGEGVYWISRYNGYFYANGEIIRYDAVEYNISGYGDVWITSLQDYQNYFSKLPFNGKIYPTGRVKIFAEPNYQTIEGQIKMVDGPVVKHGRAQFGTEIQYHQAGLSTYWTDNANIRGCKMQSNYLFNTSDGEFLLRNVSSTGTTVTTKSIVGLQVGQVISFVSGTGKLAAVGDTKITAINSVKNTETGNYSFTIDKTPVTALSSASISISYELNTTTGAAGVDNTTAAKTTRSGLIKNFMDSGYVEDTKNNLVSMNSPAMLQASALVMNGPTFEAADKPRDFISYVYKPLADRFNHFGTRLRLIGKVKNDTTIGQTGTGGSSYYSVAGTSPDSSISIAGSSGGLGVMLNPATNNGYYFEIIALSEADVSGYTAGSDINNVIFYKIVKDVTSGEAVPVKLWGGMASILVDTGDFVGQGRLNDGGDPTVYDLAVEHEKVDEKTSRFHLFINDKLVQVVDDTDPLPVYNNMALFVRGSARVMFENVYALVGDYSKNTSFLLDTPTAQVFSDHQINASDAFRKYSLSGMVQSVYLSGITSADSPKYKIYFEEFGTIMREAAYFNIRYDKAYPALYAKITPTFNRLKGYVVSGFVPTAYGAEFLVFNATDTALSLDETTGNYLQIQGVAFTQESKQSLTVDDYFSRSSSLSNPVFVEQDLVTSPIAQKELFMDIKNSRLTYGNKEFTLEVPYVQTQDDARDLMAWIISKTHKPRKSIGVKIFAMPTLQLGDIVKVQYVNADGLDEIGTDNRFVVYSIDYSRSTEGPEMTVYLSEVL